MIIIKKIKDEKAIKTKDMADMGRYSPMKKTNREIFEQTDEGTKSNIFSFEKNVDRYLQKEEESTKSLLKSLYNDIMKDYNKDITDFDKNSVKNHLYYKKFDKAIKKLNNKIPEIKALDSQIKDSMYINGTLKEFNPKELIEKVKQRRENLHTNRVDNSGLVHTIFVDASGKVDNPKMIYIDIITQTKEGENQKRVLLEKAKDWEDAINIMEKYKKQHINDSCKDASKYVIRYKEQGDNDYQETEVNSLKEFKDRIALSGIGTHYCWIMTIKKDGNRIFMGPKRLDELNENLFEDSIEDDDYSLEEMKSDYEEYKATKKKALKNYIIKKAIKQGYNEKDLRNILGNELFEDSIQDDDILPKGKMITNSKGISYYQKGGKYYSNNGWSKKEISKEEFDKEVTLAINELKDDSCEDENPYERAEKGLKKELKDSNKIDKLHKIIKTINKVKDAEKLEIGDKVKYIKRLPFDKQQEVISKIVKINGNKALLENGEEQFLLNLKLIDSNIKDVKFDKVKQSKNYTGVNPNIFGKANEMETSEEARLHYGQPCGLYKFDNGKIALVVGETASSIKNCWLDYPQANYTELGEGKKISDDNKKHQVYFYD